MVVFCEPEDRHILPFREIPPWKPFVIDSSRAVSMSFADFMRIIHCPLDDPNRAHQTKYKNIRDHPELYRPSNPDPGSVLRRAAIDEETLEEKYSF
jgi:hypothetical protein